MLLDEMYARLNDISLNKQAKRWRLRIKSLNFITAKCGEEFKSQRNGETFQTSKIPIPLFISDALTSKKTNEVSQLICAHSQKATFGFVLGVPHFS